MSTEWATIPIRELYQGLYDGPHATPKPSNVGPVFLGIKNVTEDGQLNLSEIRHIAEDDFAKWTRRVEPKPGDIVFTYEATLNRYAIIPNGFRGCLGRRMALIRPNKQKVDTRFLFYYFFTEEWRAVISRNMLAGATVDRIPLTKFPDFSVRIPPLTIQRRIAGILSAYDNLIENNQRRIKILEDMARALYREWFVNFRFPDHESVKFVDSPLGKIPEGWVIKPASDCLYINPKVTVPKSGEKPFVPMGSLSTTSMMISEIESRTGNSGAKFKNGDTLFARITPSLENGKTGFVQFLPHDHDVSFGSTEFIVLRSRTLTPEFVYCLARDEDFRGNAIKSMVGASGRQRVQEACFRQFRIAHAPPDLLERFSAITTPYFRSVRILNLQNQNLRRTRDLLLPRLLSGQIDVSEIEKVQETAA